MSGLYELEVSLEVKLEKENLEEKCNDWWLKEEVVVAVVVVGERIGMEAIGNVITYPLVTKVLQWKKDGWLIGR